jgi:hypothetical protein
MTKLRGGINSAIKKDMFQIPEHLIFNLPEPEQEEDNQVEEPIIEKPKEKSIKSKIKELFYDPKIGLVSLDKFYKKVQKIYPDIKFKDIEKFYNKQNIN